MNIKLRVHIPVAGPEKLPLLWACLSALYASNLPDWVHIRVVLNYDGPMSETFGVNDNSGFSVWRALLPKFDIDVLPELSVPAMYAQAVINAYDNGYTHMIKIDDDCMVYNFRQYLDWLFEHSDEYWSSINFWDVEDSRGYPDWFPSVPIERLNHMITKYGYRTVPVQRWVSKDSSKPTIFIYEESSFVANSIFTVRLHDLIEKKEIIDGLKMARRGVRGNLDHVLGNVFPRNRFQIITSGAAHMGIYRPELDGKYWTQYVGGKNPWDLVKEVSNG